MRENTEEKCKKQAFGMEKHHCGSCRRCSCVKILLWSLFLEGDPSLRRHCSWSKHRFRRRIPPSFAALAQNGRVTTFWETKVENHISGGTKKWNQSKNKPLKLLDNVVPCVHHENQKK